MYRIGFASLGGAPQEVVGLAMFVACVVEVDRLTAFVVLNASDHVSNMDVLNNQVLYRWLR